MRNLKTLAARIPRLSLVQWAAVVALLAFAFLCLAGGAHILFPPVEGWSR